MKIKLLTSSLILAGAISIASAGKFDQPQANILEAANPGSQIVNRGAPNSIVTLDFSVLAGESWDAQDAAVNVVANCVTGTAITGIAWNNVTLESVGASWLSEAVLSFTDSASSPGINLTVGSGDGFPGAATYDSGGVVDFTDAALPDIVALGDGTFLIQLFESYDDVAGSIDANYTAGSIDVVGLDLVADPACIFIASDSDLSVSTSTNVVGAVATGTAVAVTITVNNSGSGAATTLVVTDTLSAGLDFVSGSCDDGTVATEAGGVVTFAASDLAAGASLVCTVNETVNGFGALSNDITITSDNDLSGGNNSSAAVVNGPARIIPVNNWVALLALMLALGFFGRRLIKE